MIRAVYTHTSMYFITVFFPFITYMYMYVYNSNLSALAWKIKRGGTSINISVGVGGVTKYASCKPVRKIIRVYMVHIG